MSVVGLCGVVACLELEIAIPLADTEEDGANLFVIALSAAAAVTLSLLLHAASHNPIKPGDPEINWPVGPLVACADRDSLSSGYNAAQYWATRYKRFDAVAKTRVTQAITSAITTLFFGYVRVG